jgi:multisubunit Na+/H+ antiporter MnhG subunit
MDLDLRWPLGLIFTLFGAILTGFGLMSDPSLYRRSLDINVNTVWGVVVLIFGLAMLGLAFRAKKRGKP